MYAVGQIRPWGSIGKDGSLSPDSFRAWRMLLTAELGQEETSAYRIFLAGCLASSRQLLMKSCAMGLMVRFFKMTMPTGAWPSGCLMGRTFNSGRFAENL